MPRWQVIDLYAYEMAGNEYYGKSLFLEKMRSDSEMSILNIQNIQKMNTHRSRVLLFIYR